MKLLSVSTDMIVITILLALLEIFPSLLIIISRFCDVLYVRAGGSVTGAFAAAATTPLDVVKTRLMLGKDANGISYEGFFDTFKRVYGNNFLSFDFSS